MEGQSNYRNYCLSDFHKTIDPRGDSQEEDSLEEDSPEEEDSLEEEEDSPEEEDTPEEVEYHLEDHWEAVGDHHRSPSRKYNKGN